MRTQTFYDWLAREVLTSRMALVRLYEQRDKLLYVDAPPLRKRYMETFGAVEEAVLTAELEVALLRRKAELVQIAVNRREPVDMAVIDRALEAEREQKIAALEHDDKTLHELPQLGEQEARTLQRQYREIVSAFHPAMNPEATETQRELYERALEAYKMQNADEMKLLYEMLFAPADMPAELLPEKRGTAPEERREDYREFAAELSTDYTLAKRLYPYFAPLEEDAVVRTALDTYNAQRKEVEAEIAEIRAGFPFNAEATLRDKGRTEEYFAELRLRAGRCEAEKAELEAQIRALTEGRANG